MAIVAVAVGTLPACTNVPSFNPSLDEFSGQCSLLCMHTTNVAIAGPHC
jgi:hypothetical protein